MNTFLKIISVLAILFLAVFTAVFLSNLSVKNNGTKAGDAANIDLLKPADKETFFKSVEAPAQRTVPEYEIKNALNLGKNE
jgi:hypothetical protein